MKTITIQPAQRPDGQLPYPYHIDSKGLVGRQEFWNGKPKRLIGFDINPTDHGMSGKTIDLKEFLKNPKKAIGMYPIFFHEGGAWITYTEPIESIKINK